MIGYRNAETVLNENPSKTLAFEIIKMGRVWILEELLERLDDELDIETKRQVKISLKKIADGIISIPDWDNYVDMGQYLPLFEKIIVALSKHLGFEVKYLIWIFNLNTAFRCLTKAVPCQRGTYVGREGSIILYAYDSIPTPLEGVEYQLYYLNKTGKTLATDKFDSFEKLVKLASECISAYDHCGADNVHALAISNGETLFEVWNNSENSGFEAWDTPDNW